MNKIIILNNKKCQLITEDTNLFNDINKLLSYKLEGIQFTPAVQKGYWDGINHLMNKRGEFPSGLLKTVQNRLIERREEATMEDCRAPLKDSPGLNIEQRLTEIGKTPREHQTRIVETALKHRKGIIRAATGSGKTIAIAMLTAALNKTTIVYVVGLDLLQQFHDLFSSIFDEDIGFIGNGVCDIKRITIASIWTVGKALGIKSKEIIEDDEIEDEKFDVSNNEMILNMLKDAKLHIFDECHSITCTTARLIHDKIDPEHIYGFSGTPYKELGDDLVITGILGEQIINVPASELIEKGLLVQPIIKFITIPKMSMPKETYHTIYKNYVVENPDRNASILKETKELISKKYKVLVLFKQINHGKILDQLFENNNINHIMLSGKDDLERRNEAKEMINNGEIDVILASSIFDLGVDITILNALVLGSGGKSIIRTLQRVGRIIRKHPGKKFAAVVEFYDQTKYLKKHSLRRAEIYLSEPGFKVFVSPEMKKH